METWKKVIGYEGLYSVSCFGRVRRDLQSPGTKMGKILRPRKTMGNYLVVGLSKNGRSKNFYIHQLVMGTFFGLKPIGHQINHRDGDKRNNELFNLHYCTPSENIRHAVKNGLSLIGTKNGSSKLNDLIVKNIRKIYASGIVNQREIAECFNIDPSMVSRIVNNKNWRHL